MLWQLANSGELSDVSSTCYKWFLVVIRTEMKFNVVGYALHFEQVCLEILARKEVTMLEIVNLVVCIC